MFAQIVTDSQSKVTLSNGQGLNEADKTLISFKLEIMPKIFASKQLSEK